MIQSGPLRAARSLAYSSLIIAVGAAAQVWLFYHEMGIVADRAMMALVGSATMAVYTLQRVVRFRGQIPEMVSERHYWMDKHRMVLLVIALVCGLLSIFLATGMITIHWLKFAPLALITVLYTMPLPGIGVKRYGLRELPYFKILFIAISWAAVTVVLPSIHSFGDLDPSSWSIALERGLFIFAITVPFDIRDMLRDSAARKTIPQVLGLTMARYAAIAALLLSYAVLLVRSSSTGNLLLGLGIVHVFAALLIMRARPSRHELFFTGALDGLLVLGPLLVFLLDRYF